MQPGRSQGRSFSMIGWKILYKEKDMKNVKTEGKDVAVTTRQVKTPARKPDAAKAAVIITTRDVKVKK